MFNTVGPRTCARVSRENWSTPRGLVHGPESPGTAGQNRGPSDTSVSRPGQLVDPGGPWTRARGARGICLTLQDLELVPESLETAGPPAVLWTLAFVARDSWSNLLAVAHKPESPRRAGQPPGHSDMITRHPEQLVKPTGRRTMARGARAIGSTPRSFRPAPESPRTAGRSCRPSNPGHSRPGQLVNSAGHRTCDRIAQDC